MISRYTNPEMGRIWSDQRKYETWLQVELAAVEAMARAGIVAEEAAREIRSRAAFADVACGIRRNNPGPRHGLGRGHFDLQPGFVLPLVAPDATHFRMRVTPDHLSEIISLE